MITPAEEAALAMRSLSPQAIDVIADQMGSRPVVLARATYLQIPINVATTLMFSNIEALSLVPGDQFELVANGVINTGGVAQAFVIGIGLLQSSNYPLLNITRNLTIATPAAWTYRATITVCAATTAGASSGKRALINSYNQSVYFGGTATMMVSDAAASGGRYTGGLPALNPSTMIAITDPTVVVFDNSTQMGLNLFVSLAGGSMSINGGYILGL